jgi:hypothetical protein
MTMLSLIVLRSNSFVIKGRVSEAQEIERRIASMAEVVFDEGEE